MASIEDWLDAARGIARNRECVDAWRAGYAAMAEAIESVDEPLEEDVEGLCVYDCPGVAHPQCKCYGNEAKEGEW